MAVRLRQEMRWICVPPASYQQEVRLPIAVGAVGCVDAAQTPDGLAQLSASDCQWLQSAADEPIEIFSELDLQRNEVRKVEKFRGGKLGYASKNSATEGTSLGIIPVPPGRD